MIITIISDTHTKHQQLDSFLPGGDILIHAGDIMNSGYDKEDISDFLDWFDSLSQYKSKIFIAGNHDRYFENHPFETNQILEDYLNTEYLQDSWTHYVNENYNEGCKIYGSPWQPAFFNWAFNLPRNGSQLQEKWDLIPNDTDILITHGPAWGKLDTVKNKNEHLGCELLTKRIDEIKPKIHICGHIHGGRGVYYNGETHFFNASVLNERYNFENTPITIDWDPKTNDLNFIKF